jgi:formate-dependent nitrite reductase membrane component NrfD
MIELESILAIVIVLITINLLFVGFYIVMVLKDVRRTVRKAENVISEVDRTVTDGIEKANAIQAPLQALAATTAALAGVVKGTEVVRRATQSIMGGEHGTVKPTKEAKTEKFNRPKFFKGK